METKNYTKIYRTIHWAVAITFFLLLITIFLRLTWMNKTNMANIIREYLLGTDQTLSQEQLFAIAKRIREPMWNWHTYLGYVLVVLFSIRFTLPLFGKMKFSNPIAKKLSNKVRFQKWTYIIFYICVVGSLTTGLLIEWGPEAWEKSVEGVHVLSIYYLLTFIIIHVGGVLVAEFSDQKGIISRIISGRKHQ